MPRLLPACLDYEVPVSSSRARSCDGNKIGLRAVSGMTSKILAVLVSPMRTLWDRPASLEEQS